MTNAPPTSDPHQVPTWEEVAESHGRFLYTVAYRLTGNHDDTQDLVQEVLLRVQKGLATYKPGNFEGWLARITQNVFLDQVRAKKRRPTEALPDDPDRVLEGAPGADIALDHAGLPDHIQDAIRSLAPDYRSAVVLADVVGLNYNEISEALGVPVGTVRSRIHRGRHRLRELIEVTP
ncbi:MAG: sigma-70 family RNA polymerase sigma factor [Acidimicrobiales bacterium]|nr:sigma-70 family RNA polymerase sigma factor [Acidimicrobiales bacterium]